MELRHIPIIESQIEDVRDLVLIHEKIQKDKNKEMKKHFSTLITDSINSEVKTKL